MQDEKLEEIGVAQGDIIRLKSHSTKWYYGIDCKRRIAEMKQASTALDITASGPTYTQNAKRRKVNVWYEMDYLDGGAVTWRTTPPIPKEGHGRNCDNNVHYFEATVGKMVPLLPTLKPGFYYDKEPSDVKDNFFIP